MGCSRPKRQSISPARAARFATVGNVSFHDLPIPPPHPVRCLDPDLIRVIKPRLGQRCRSAGLFEGPASAVVAAVEMNERRLIISDTVVP